MKSEIVRLQHEQAAMKERIKDNKEKIKMNKQLPYLVGNVVEVSLMLTYLLHGYKLTHMHTSYSMLILRRMRRMDPTLTWTTKEKESVQLLKLQQDR